MGEKTRIGERLPSGSKLIDQKLSILRRVALPVTSQYFFIRVETKVLDSQGCRAIRVGTRVLDSQGCWVGP